MPTRKLRRVIKHPDAEARPISPGVTEPASLIDLLGAMQQHDVSFLPISFQVGLDILGRGLSGTVRQASADVGTALAFKQGVPSRQERDDRCAQDWYSLVTEITVLQHPSIRDNHHVVNILGVCFTVGLTTNSSRTAWPLLVSRKMPLGDLGGFLSRREQEGMLTPALRLQLFAEVLEAIHTLHASGVAHGDIKPSNFLVDAQGEELNCLVNDFGSCVIKGQRRFPTMSFPWNAPELHTVSNELDFHQLSDMDLFSLGLVCVHVLMPLKELRDARLCFLRFPDQSDKDWENLLQDLRCMKEQTVGKNSLSQRLLDAVSQAELESDVKRALTSIISGTIAAQMGGRKFPWNESFIIVKDHLSVGFHVGPSDNVAMPNLTGGTTSSQPHDKHLIFNLHALIGELDDTDYVLRETITRDLQSKAQSCACNECAEDYALQVAVCFEIGFGCTADKATALQWLDRSNKSQASINYILERIGADYKGTNQVSAAVLRELGIGVLQTVDRTTEYETTGRLREAEESLRNEIEARSRNFGVDHICLARHLRELTEVLRAQSRHRDAAQFQEMAMNILKRKFDKDHPSVVMAELGLAVIWNELGFHRRAESTITRLVPILTTSLGEGNPDVLAAMRLQAHGMMASGNLEGAEDAFRHVLSLRSKVLGPHHPNTTNSRLDLVTALRMRGKLTSALKELQAAEAEAERGIDGDWLRLADLKMCQAQLYADLGSLDKALENSKAAERAIQRLKVDCRSFASVSERLARAEVLHALCEWSSAEVLLRGIISDLGDGGTHRRWTKSKLAQNMLYQGRDTDAMSLAKDTIKSLGSTPLEVEPNTYMNCINIVCEVCLKSRRASAEEELTKFFDACVSTYGNQHPLSVQAATSLARFWSLQRQFGKAQVLLEPLLARLRDEPSGSTIAIASNICQLYSERGLGDEALQLCGEAIQWAVDIAGEFHLETYGMRHVLANCLLRMNRLSEAEDVLLWLDGKCNDVRLATEVKLSLAMLKTLQGCEVEASRHAGEAEELIATKSGPLDSMKLRVADYVLSSELAVSGLHTDLERRIIEHVRLQGEVLGASHPTRLDRLTDLAYRYAQSGRLDDAKGRFEEVEGLGGIDEHQQPAQSATLLAKTADLYYRLNKFEDAERLERRALAIRERIYSLKANAVLITKSNLGSTLVGLRKFTEAEQLFREVLEARQEDTVANAQFGARLLGAHKDLAGVLYHRQMLDESLLHYLEALRLAREADSLPDTIQDIEECIGVVKAGQLRDSQPATILTTVLDN